MVNQSIYEEEINLRSYVDVVRRRWKVIAFLTVMVVLFVFWFSIKQKPVYDAKATILVRMGGGGNSPFAQLAGLGALAGVNMSSGGGGIDDLMQIIQSRAVAEKVLEDLKLKERIAGWNNPKILPAQLVSSVQGMLKHPRTVGNLIELHVSYSDPVLAAEIANGFADALSYYWNKLNYTEARKKKEYIEAQLPKVEEGLKIAEGKYKNFTRLSPKAASLSGLASAHQSMGVEVARLAQELEIQNSVYAMLRKECETVKLEEAKEVIPFAVIDRAEKPLSKSKPNVKSNVMIGLVVGLFSGIIIAFFQEYWEKSGGEKA